MAVTTGDPMRVPLTPVAIPVGILSEKPMGRSPSARHEQRGGGLLHETKVTLTAEVARPTFTIAGRACDIRVRGRARVAVIADRLVRSPGARCGQRRRRLHLLDRRQ